MTIVIKNLKEKKCVIKGILKFDDYKNCLLNNEIILKSQQIFKIEANNAYTGEINKIALNSNDDKRLQSFIKVLSYPYGVIAGKTCNKKLNPIFTELFIRERKLNISVVFISQSYYKIPKENRLITTHFFIVKIPNKR